MICTLFSRPGATVFVDQFSYQFALRIFRDHGLQIRAIPRSRNGEFDLDRFEKSLAKRRTSVALIYLTPTFGNPTGHTISQLERHRLVLMAAQKEMLVVADEAYRPLAFPNTAKLPAPMDSFDPTGRAVVTLGSCTKLVAPSLRVGWMKFGGDGKCETRNNKLSPRELLLTSGLVLNGGALNHFSSLLAARVLSSREFSSHLDRVRRELSDRCAVTCEAVREGFDPETVKFEIPKGGYYLWLALRFSKTDKHLKNFLIQAAKVGLTLLVDETFAAGKISERERWRHIRIAFARNQPLVTLEGIRRLSKLYRKFS
jgi:DNA-binding transcriptional MocR family regulator